MTWAQRLKRVFDIDIETCSECGGDVKVIASIEDPVVIRTILAHLDKKGAIVVGVGVGGVGGYAVQIASAMEDWEVVGRVHGEFFGDVRPVSTMVLVAGSIEPDWLVEFEADAIVADP